MASDVDQLCHRWHGCRRACVYQRASGGGPGHQMGSSPSAQQPRSVLAPPVLPSVKDPRSQACHRARGRACASRRGRTRARDSPQVVALSGRPTGRRLEAQGRARAPAHRQPRRARNENMARERQRTLGGIANGALSGAVRGVGQVRGIRQSHHERTAWRRGEPCSWARLGVEVGLGRGVRVASERATRPPISSTPASADRMLKTSAWWTARRGRLNSPEGPRWRSHSDGPDQNPPVSGICRQDW